MRSLRTGNAYAYLSLEPMSSPGWFYFCLCRACLTSWMAKKCVEPEQDPTPMRWSVESSFWTGLQNVWLCSLFPIYVHFQPWESRLKLNRSLFMCSQSCNEDGKHGPCLWLHVYKPEGLPWGEGLSLIFKQLCFVRVEKVEGMENP